MAIDYIAAPYFKGTKIGRLIWELPTLDSLYHVGMRSLKNTS